MRNFAISKVYASALLELAREAGQLDEISAGLRGFAELLESSADLRQVFLSPERGFAEKRAVLERLLEGEPELLRRFLLVLVRKRREAAFGDVARVFEYLRDREERRLRGRLRSALPLESERREAVEKVLGEKTGLEVRLEAEQDESLLAGLVLILEDQTLDGSLRTRLRRMKDRLLTAELGKE